MRELLLAIGIVLAVCAAGCSPDCVATGCSGHICADGVQESTCEWTCRYGCYDHAVCEEQDDGECGWTRTEAFQECAADCDANGP